MKEGCPKKKLKEIKLMIKPSNLARVPPISSIFQNCEREDTAQRIMYFLSKSGNSFRKMTWEEYARKAECKDNSYAKERFNAVIDYTISLDTAKLFSPIWKEIIDG